MRLNELQDQVGRGQYRVDTQAVADAILRRVLDGILPPSPRPRDQEECS